MCDSEWIVVYDVPVKRAEQVVKRIYTWTEGMGQLFERAGGEKFPMQVKPFLDGPAKELMEIRATTERRRREFRELETALKGEKALRRRRGLFDAGGQLLGWLFGTATTTELEEIHSRLEKTESKGVEMVHLMKEQATLLNVTVRHLVEHETAINDLIAAVGAVHKEQQQLLREFENS